MNYNNLKSDFQTRYFTKNEPSVVFAGKKLFLLGEGVSEYTGGISANLSAGTALAFNFNPSVFTVQSAESDIAYLCERDMLSCYNEDNLARSIFKKIDELSNASEIQGLDMLFENNTKNSDFFNYNDAVLLAVSCISEEKEHFMPPTASAYHTLYRGADARDFSENAVSFSGKKIIIVTTGIKKQDIGAMCRAAIKKLPEGSSLSEPNLPEKAFSSADKELLSFITEERGRVEDFRKTVDFKDACGIISKSGEGLFSLSDSDKLITLQGILSHTDSALAFRPTFGNSAVYVIAEDFAVDTLVRRVEEEYEKKAGSKPAFYICDIVSNKIIH